MSSPYKTLFVIVDNETGQYVTANSRCAWISKHNALNAYYIDLGNYGKNPYEEQYRYEIVDIIAETEELQQDLDYYRDKVFSYYEKEINECLNG